MCIIYFVYKKRELKESSMNKKKRYKTLWLNVVLLQEDLIRTSSSDFIGPTTSDEDELEWDDVN